MADDTLTPKPTPPKGVKGFQSGHPRYGGRKKGSPLKRTAEAREIAERLNFHPVEFLIQCAMGTMPNGDGTVTELDTVQRLDAAKNVAPYLAPKLNATQVTGKDEGPIQTQQLPTDAIMRDPKLAEALGELALMMAEGSEDSVN
jgi:hypothetical protein